jgi:hypothetical protein
METEKLKEKKKKIKKAKNKKLGMGIFPSPNFLFIDAHYFIKSENNYKVQHY